MNEKQKVKLLVEEYFKEKESNDNTYTFSTTGDDYNPHQVAHSTFFNNNNNLARNRNKYSDNSDDDYSNSDMYWVFLT